VNSRTTSFREITMAVKCDGKQHKVDTVRKWGQGIGLQAAVDNSMQAAWDYAFKLIGSGLYKCQRPCDPMPWVKVRPASNPAQPDATIPRRPKAGDRVFVLRSWDIWLFCSERGEDLPR
jgi:hypothetical protein